MNLFNLLLLTNFLMLVAAFVAAAKWPVWHFRLIAGVAICAFISALHQVVTGQGSSFASLFTTLLVALITWRALLSARSLRERFKH